MKRCDAALKDRIAVVTGANKGLGKIIVRELAAAGCTVAAIGRDKELNKQVQRELSGYGKITFYAADLAQPAGIAEMWRAVCREQGVPDILINNAGVSCFEPAEEIAEDKCEAMLDINLKALYRCCKMAIPGMLKKRSGRIINVSSIYGIRADKGTGVYSMTKFGSVGYTRALHAELYSHGIHASVFCPVSFEQGAVLKPEFVASMIVDSIKAAKPANQYVLLTRRIGCLGIILTVRSRWSVLKNLDLNTYSFHFKRLSAQGQNG